MSAVNVRAILADCESVLRAVESCEGSYLDGKADQLASVNRAVAELLKCSDATVKAFEALGRTNNIVAQLESHRECERALVEQKAVLARYSGEGA